MVMATNSLGAAVIAGLPATYSARKYQRCVSIAAKPPLAQFVAQTWPGTTALQWAGFMSNGSGNEDTATSADPADFHEIGFFGTTAGPSSLDVCPNTDTSEENDWFHFFNNPKVRELLGRDGCMNNGCWKESNGGFPDQCAIGLVSMLAKYQTIHNSLPAGLRPESPSSTWAMALTFAGWSAGVGTITRRIREMGSRLNAPEDQRWDQYRTLMAQDILSGAQSISERKHRNPAYTVMRTQQKIAAATQNYPQNDIDVVITMAAFGENPAPLGIRIQQMVLHPTNNIFPWLIAAGLTYAAYEVLK